MIRKRLRLPDGSLVTAKSYLAHKRNALQTPHDVDAFNGEMLERVINVIANMIPPGALAYILDCPPGVIADHPGDLEAAAQRERELSECLNDGYGGD